MGGSSFFVFRVFNSSNKLWCVWSRSKVSLKRFGLEGLFMGKLFFSLVGGFYICI